MKLRRHRWRGGRSRPPTTTPTWERLASGGSAAQARIESADLLRALRRAVAEELSPRQREVFVAVALNDVEIDAVAEQLHSTRGAVYKVLHDARRKLRLRLEREGHLDRWRRDERTRSADAAARHPGRGSPAARAGWQCSPSTSRSSSRAATPASSSRPRRAPAQLPRMRGGLRRPPNDRARRLSGASHRAFDKVLTSRPSAAPVARSRSRPVGGERRVRRRRGELGSEHPGADRRSTFSLACSGPFTLSEVMPSRRAQCPPSVHERPPAAW